MKRLLFSISTFVLLSLLPSCWWKYEEAKKDGLFVVNVLDKDVYDDCHIKGSIHVPLDHIEQFAQTLDKNAEVVLYCTNFLCTASFYAGKKLISMGFKQVWIYEGGTAEWYQKGFPVEGKCTYPYLKKVIKKDEQGEHDEGVNVINIDDLARKLHIERAA